MTKTVSLLMVLTAFVLGLLAGRFGLPRSPATEASVAVSGAKTDSLSKATACSIANDFLIKHHGQAATHLPCKNFSPSTWEATICVGGTNNVFFKRYPEEGWKAQDIILGSGCA